MASFGQKKFDKVSFYMRKDFRGEDKIVSVYINRYNDNDKLYYINKYMNTKAEIKTKDTLPYLIIPENKSLYLKECKYNDNEYEDILNDNDGEKKIDILNDEPDNF